MWGGVCAYALDEILQLYLVQEAKKKDESTVPAGCICIMHPSATYLDHNRAYRRLDKSHALSNPVYYEATWHKFTALKAQTLEYLQEFSIFLPHPYSFEKKEKIISPIIPHPKFPSSNNWQTELSCT